MQQQTKGIKDKMQQEKQNLRVVIFPSPDGYVATCLDLCLVAEEKTQKKAASGITRLINANLALAKDGASAEELRYDAPSDYFHMFGQGTTYKYAPKLSLQAKKWYSGIEFSTHQG